jgi:AmmeMemoRadiSam system protein B
MFYPARDSELRSVVADLLGPSAPQPVAEVPKALIVPHAGYVYSGPVAASAYRLLAPVRDRIRRVVLLGPAHRVYLEGMALPATTSFATPLGTIPIDREAVAAIADLPGVCLSDEAHAQEHSLEVQLPFLQVVLGQFTLVPLVVGDATRETVTEVLETLWGGKETLIVISSDLSHYLSYDKAINRDCRTRDAIEHLDARYIGHDDACGATPVGGLLIAAKRRAMGVVTLDLRNSGDTAGSKDHVVGYGAWMLVEPG